MSVESKALAHNVRRAVKSRAYTVTFSRSTSGGSYDPTTATVSGATTSSERATGMYVNKQIARSLDGSLVTDQSVFVMLPDNLAKIPQDGDELTKNGVTAKIGSVRTIKSGDTTILYLCEVAS